MFGWLRPTCSTFDRCFKLLVREAVHLARRRKVSRADRAARRGVLSSSTGRDVVVPVRYSVFE